MNAYGAIVEGIGNELLFVISCMGTILFLIMAWMSTRVNWELVPIRITLPRYPRENQGTETRIASTTEHTELDTANSTDNVSAAGSDTGSENELNSNTCVRKRSPGQISSSAVQKNTSSSDDESKANTEEQVNITRSKKRLVIKLQYLNDRTRFVHASPTMSVNRFKKKHFLDELVNQKKNVRLIFQGRELVDVLPNETGFTSGVKPKRRRLCDYGITDGSTIHCLITASVLSSSVNRSSSGNDPGNSGSIFGFQATSSDSVLTEFDMGTRIMKPLFAFLLLFTWFFRIAYRQYFNSVSTFALVALTVFFCGAVFTVSLVNATSTVASLFGISFADSDISSQQSEEVDNSSTSHLHQDDVQVVTVTMVARRILTQTPTSQTNNTALSSEETDDGNNNSSNPVIEDEITSEF
ncbi:unnamed protein product [Heterobilharzia americana]|nr:unnamed protein product [Heterobilharzia americana]